MKSWQDSFRAFLHPRVITMLFFGLSAGIPLLLIFSSLGLWLREAGVERATVTFFSWAALGYSFKFVWAPLVDCLPLPFLTRKLGRRRAWILLSQLAIITAILLMGMTDPSSGMSQLKVMALAAVMLGFSSATQDIVIDAYRIESAPTELQALMSSTYIAGYRIGMLVSGAGSLFLAGYLGSELDSYNYSAWRITYACMAVVMLIGVFTTLLVNEPESNRETLIKYPTEIYFKFFVVFLVAATGFVISFLLSSDIASMWKGNLNSVINNQAISNFCIELLRLTLGIIVALSITVISIKINFIQQQVINESYVAPVADFFQRYGVKLAILLLALIGLYRISDIVLGVIANIFFQEIGYSKIEIASIVKTFGLFMTILGGFLGGVLSIRFGVIKILFVGALLTVLTNLLFMLLAIKGYDITLLYFVISADNLSAGLASAAFVAFLSRLTNISFTAMQYAIFSSLMTLLPKLIGGYSGSIVENIGYTQFFLVASLIGIPVLWIIYLADKHLKFE
jgi:MFS transporter, PAT family, beta-lactamase induction signal transducer AmpG